jgi:hypothetical protein
VAKRTNVGAAPSRDHWQGVADAARQQAIADDWERPLRAVAQGNTSGNKVKLHPGWDAAFKRARAG